MLSLGTGKSNIFLGNVLRLSTEKKYTLKILACYENLKMF